jgi:hypothetical protein
MYRLWGAVLSLCFMIFIAAEGFGGGQAAAANKQGRGQSSQAKQAQKQKQVKVNGVVLDQRTIQQIETAYRTRLVGGSFWYDPVSGLWGVWGGPAFGQIMPGLALGGPLSFKASGGETNIVINGRAIHTLEYQAIIAAQGYAIPGRYWLDARGNLGTEGGPFLFNIYATGMGQSGRSWYHAGPGGYMASDGDCVGYTAPGGQTFLAGC